MPPRLLKRLKKLFPSRVSLPIYTLIALNVGLLGIFLYPNLPKTAASYGEVAHLASSQRDFPYLSQYFKDLSDSKGAPYAFEVLKRMPTFPGVDMHLLGHIVGDELYKQQGLEGIKICTPDFRNACSHTIVIGTLFEDGIEALPAIAETCKKAPGGSGAYTMCYHGLGHGILAFVDYEVPEAVELCKKTGTEAYHNREYIECIGGSIMELIGGVHDPVQREKKALVYFKKNDPVYPCNASFMPDEARNICYTYITPHLFEAAGANLAAPTPEEFEKAFTYCASVREKNNNRLSCYAGFGKEFAVLGAQRDVRVVDALNTEKMKTIYGWCTLAHNADAVRICSDSILSSLYWGGENNVEGSIRYCGAIEGKEDKDHCFEQLNDLVRSYVKAPAVQRKYCEALPQSKQNACTVFFNLQ